MADSAAVQCHTGSPSGMFFSPGMGLWSLISRAPSPSALSACVRHNPSQMHAGGAAASCESLPALSVSLSPRVTPGWQSVTLDGFIMDLLAHLFACFGDLFDVNLSFTLCVSRLHFFLPVLDTNTLNSETPGLCHFTPPALRVTTNTIPLPPLSSTSHVCHSEEAQCGFKGRTSMSCFTLFTINPSLLPSVFTARWRKSSGKGNIKQSEQHNAEQILPTRPGIGSNEWQTYHVVNFNSLFLTYQVLFKLLIRNKKREGKH